jgi:hypothetical protein
MSEAPDPNQALGFVGWIAPWFAVTIFGEHRSRERTISSLMQSASPPRRCHDDSSHAVPASTDPEGLVSKLLLSLSFSIFFPLLCTALLGVIDNLFLS